MVDVGQHEYIHRLLSWLFTSGLKLLPVQDVPPRCPDSLWNHDFTVLSLSLFTLLLRLKQNCKLLFGWSGALKNFIFMPLDRACDLKWLCVHFPAMFSVPIWTLALPAWYLYTSRFFLSSYPFQGAVRELLDLTEICHVGVFWPLQWGHDYSSLSKDSSHIFCVCFICHKLSIGLSP